MTFSPRDYFPDALLSKLIDARVQRPELAFESAQARIRRPRITLDGRLNIIAADHPARNVTKVGDNPLAMADRREYLARILRVLASPRVDGVMATMDILEDLLVIDAFLREAGAETVLDNRVVIASLNRGGLAGAKWELDDPMTGASASTCKEWHFDGAKTLLRVDLAEPASLKTMLACAAAINDCNALHLPMFLEPLAVSKTEKGYPVTKTAEAVAQLAGISSALGDSSRYLWLKLPYCENFEVVARSTTLPILLLGGESFGDPSPFLRQMASAMASGPNVRGAMVGRNVVFPGAADPCAIAEAVGLVIHDNVPVEEAIAVSAQSSVPINRLHAAASGGRQ